MKRFAVVLAVACVASSTSAFARGGMGHFGGRRGGHGVMYGRRPRCKRNLTISEAFGCGHVFGL